MCASPAGQSTASPPPVVLTLPAKAVGRDQRLSRIAGWLCVGLVVCLAIWLVSIVVALRHDWDGSTNSIRAYFDAASFAVVGIAVGSLFAVLSFRRAATEPGSSRVEASAAGVIYCPAGCDFCPAFAWDEFAAIGSANPLNRAAEGLIVREPRWTTTTDGALMAIKTIPLHQYDRHWRTGTMGDLIRQNAPHLLEP